MESVQKVGVACKGRDITGHLSIDYVLGREPARCNKNWRGFALKFVGGAKQI